jgi:tetratricopeptide (TPR) repeat protein
MQHVTAFSRPQTVPAVPAAAPRSTWWILNSWRDLILYVGTPLLLVPMFALAQARWSAQDIYVFVAAFGAMGHHLPGMIRAYGDRALFERFRWRFIIAPIFLLAVCVAFYWWDLKGIILVVFFWGVWHGMMQTYGFCRIYDAKMGSFAALTRRLDFAACAIWFAAAVFLSSSRMTDTLETYYASGGLYISPGLLQTAQKIFLIAAIAVSILFLINFVRMWVIGKRPNPVKLALLVTSISFWWYCNNGVTNILAGIALFEVFHDVQYLSLVWIYNRNRVEKDSSIGGFMRFVFRRSGSLIGLYVGLVFAYGSLGYFNSRIEIDTIKRVLTGVVAASGLLHFYYDGFIWKVRERSTRESLGLTGGNAAASSSQFLPSWFGHGLKWVAVFVLPLGALWLGQTYGGVPKARPQAWLVDNLPQEPRAHLKYGVALEGIGRTNDAIGQYRFAVEHDPNSAEAHFNLAGALLEDAKVEEAAAHFEQALRTEPGSADYRADYGYALERLGRNDEARAQYETALRAKPKSALFHQRFARYLAKRHDVAAAMSHYREAARLKPNDAETRAEFGGLLLDQNQLEEAKAELLEAARLDPKRADVRNNLGRIYFSQGQVSQAIVQYQEALRLDPKFADAERNLRLAQGNETRFQSRSPR